MGWWRCRKGETEAVLFLSVPTYVCVSGKGEAKKVVMMQRSQPVCSCRYNNICASFERERELAWQKGNLFRKRGGQLCRAHQCLAELHQLRSPEELVAARRTYHA
jgi:hypothetical protein